MPTALLQDPVAVFCWLAALVALIFWLSELPTLRGWFTYVPPMVHCYFVPTISSTLGVTPLSSPAYDLMRLLLLPIALFGAALRFRRTPQMHKRLMTAAAVSLAIASVARLDFLPSPPARQFVALFLWSAPILIAIAHDLKQLKITGPLYCVAK